MVDLTVCACVTEDNILDVNRHKIKYWLTD